VESCLQVVDLLKDGLFNHMESSDLQYAPHFKAREVDAILAANETLPVAVLRKRSIGSRIQQGTW
jgi:hypothetical protein